MIKKNLPALALLIILLNSCSNTRQPPGIARVWAVDDGEKIKREDINNLLANDPANTAWQNNGIHIFGGKNEIVAFQLIIQADTAGAEKVNVEISDLVNGDFIIPGSAKGPADPFDYRGRNIELFTQHYLHMSKRSPPLWFFAESAAPGAYYSGWVPDALIPFAAAEGKGGAPFSIGPDNNQGVWVDILIPKNALPGKYAGKATITVSDKVYTSIPINMQVYDFTLSDSTHLDNMFGLYPNAVADRHGTPRESPEYYAIEAKYHQMAHRHRFDLVRRVNNLENMTAYHKRYLTGELYTPGHQYAGPGENVGNTTFSIGYAGSIPGEYGNSVSTMTETSWRSGSDAWENWFLQNAPKVKRHKYLYPDEPDFQGPEGAKGTTSMDTIKMQARWTHNNPGIGKNIPAMVTNKIKPILKGYVDFWSVSSQEAMTLTDPVELAAEKAKGRIFGIYNGYRPGMGAVVSDADAVEFRVMPWIVWKYNVDQYFYWSANYWTKLNVFENPLTYEDRINGDGTFLYPGQDMLFPEEDRGLAGPLSSIRAKNWRRGAQDYEYFWLARQAGMEKELKAVLDECVPAGLWEAKSLENISWSSRGYKFEEYRKRLARMLSEKILSNSSAAK
ncbi:MAG TPA: DUF4091 domain-containing protein [Flavitalea sp.]|nr:DUF4091 domain-containing protein [Flavitalea sp.]